MNDWVMCNFFQKAYPRNIDKKRFGYPYPVPVWKQFFDILIRLQTHYPAGYPTAKPVSSEISDLRNFWLHTMYACTE